MAIRKGEKIMYYGQAEPLPTPLAPPKKTPVKVTVSIKSFESFKSIDKALAKIKEIQKSNPDLVFNTNIEVDLKC